MLLGLLLRWRVAHGSWRHVLSLACLFLGVGTTALITLTPIGFFLLDPLENRFPVPALPEEINGVIVLGTAPPAGLPEGQRVFCPNELGDLGPRLTAMLELARRYPQARLVFTGGDTSFSGDAPWREADLARACLTGQGIATERLIFEDQARNSYENAQNSLDLVQPDSNSHWILVTSAAHMPRAMGAFRQAGWPRLTAWPVGIHSRPVFSWTKPGLSYKLNLVERALHEWIGLTVYRLLGLSSKWFPAP